jgi:acyl-CoA synthetase (AMP-forming)/AMP-acid ligase II
MKALNYSKYEAVTKDNGLISISPKLDQFGELVVMEDDIAKVNPSRYDYKEQASLLAAAPEMYAALVEYVKSYEENRSQMKAMRMAKDAIKSALSH